MPDLINFDHCYVLQDDFTRCLDKFFVGDDRDQQFWRRTAFEKWFNFLEGWVSAHRDHVIPAMLERRGEEILGHYGFLDDAEEPAPTPPRGFSEVVKRAFLELLFMSWKSPKEYLDLVGHHGFKHLVDAKRVRNRIAHCTNVQQLWIDKGELTSLIESNLWFMNAIRQIDYSGLPVEAIGGPN